VQEASPKGNSNRNFFHGAGSAGTYSAVFKPNQPPCMKKFHLHNQRKIKIRTMCLSRTSSQWMEKFQWHNKEKINVKLVILLKKTIKYK